MPIEKAPPGEGARTATPGRDRARLASGIAAAFAAFLTGVGVAQAGESAPIVGATRLSVLEDPVALDHAVMSKIYPEDAGTMYVTLRGGGISVFDVSDPAQPTLRTRWSSEEDVEGQDRRGDLLVVVARRGFLLTFDVSRPDRISPLGRLELATRADGFTCLVAGMLQAFAGPFAALHVKLYDAPGGRRYALVTATATGELLAVDVSDPTKPVQAGRIDTDVQFIEGIYVHRDHAFVGGFGWSDVLRAVDVSDPGRMRIVHTLADESYRQMVSEMSPARPDLLFVALWNDEGGLAVFDVSDPPRFRLVGRLVMPELARSNRVKLQGEHAFLPLEVDPGGFAILDASDPAAPTLVHLATDIPGISTPYTLEVTRDHLYVFGSREPRMAVFRLDRGAADEGRRAVDDGRTRE